MINTFEDTAGREFSLQDICNLAEEDFEYQIVVGSDSQVHRKKRKIKFITCIVLYKKGKGGRIFKYVEWESLPPRVKIKNKYERKQNAMTFLRKRLTSEVWRSVQTGFSLQPLLPANAEIVIDVDLNKNPKHKSNDYLQELAGMVQGSGFQCRSKPDSWAAMCVADRFSK